MRSYTAVTELPVYKGSKEQLERAYQRYRFAYQFCKGKDVLELACGAGQGLGYLAEAAKRIVGSDIDEKNLSFARREYSGRKDIEIHGFDAQDIPFGDRSFDVVILYEALYYIEDAGRFINEAYRILRDDGIIIICSVNKDWSDFNPSPQSIRYFSVPELSLLLKRKFPKIEFFGGFSAGAKGGRDTLISFLKRTAVSLNLMPKTMKGKEALKRIFFGRLYPLPSQIKEGIAEYIAPQRIRDDTKDTLHKVIFSVGYKEG